MNLHELHRIDELMSIRLKFCIIASALHSPTGLAKKIKRVIVGQITAKQREPAKMSALISRLIPSLPSSYFLGKWRRPRNLMSPPLAC